MSAASAPNTDLTGFVGALGYAGYFHSTLIVHVPGGLEFPGGITYDLNLSLRFTEDFTQATVAMYYLAYNSTKDPGVVIQELRNESAPYTFSQFTNGVLPLPHLQELGIPSTSVIPPPLPHDLGLNDPAAPWGAGTFLGNYILD
jgi:hypothetical protein